jgi:Na+-driven multidrug efflux pump
MSSAWKVLSVFVFFDCMQAVASGNISALSLMSKVKYVTLFDYWVIGIPLSSICIFYYNLELKGLWYGPTVAVFLNFLFYEYYVRSADW